MQLAEVSADIIECPLHPEGRGLELFVRLRGATDHDTVITVREALLIIAAIETDGDESGSETSRAREGLLHEDHRDVGLSRVKIAMINGAASGSAFRATGPYLSPRDCLIGFSGDLEQHPLAESRTARG
jgi:hypothetical protein